MPLKWKIWRGEALVKCWDLDEAAQAALAILREEPRCAEALCLRALTMHLMDSHPLSTVQQFLTQALTFDPDMKKARLLLKRVKLLESIKKEGNDFFQQKDYTAAVECYNRFVQEDPQGGVIRAKVLSNRAACFSMVGFSNLDGQSKRMSFRL